MSYVNNNNAFSHIFMGNVHLGLDKALIDVLGQGDFQVERRYLFMIVSESVILLVGFNLPQKSLVFSFKQFVFVLCHFQFHPQLVNYVIFLIDFHLGR
jgi:hypothetical protein